ncbi:uncharacterized protein LOC108089832 isoform X2 [Drosophila ficusphila]|uniref:uncharacterized protein LOC108089832 isoform X2 n=1 Tax=Drosophila ficusphila TaxID=30025 RepID=UPI0007E6B6B9|nr:uncharacterized protein LOC108089832 isoform X2 [Drosophila ficusphila]
MHKFIKHDPDDKKVKRLYHQRYRSEWEKFPSFSSWLRPSNDGYSAHCSICDANVLARLASIKQHLITRKHQNMVKSELCKMEHDPELEASITLPKPKVKPKAKPKPKSKQSKIKNEVKEEHMEEDEIASNDSILDDLLGTEPLEQEYVVENELLEDQQQEPDVHDQVAYEEELIHIKQNEPELHGEYRADSMSEDVIISEFDLFGKSLALQLNNMDLEDALLCQERLQVVLTEFRLKILKRQREGKRNT